MTIIPIRPRLIIRNISRYDVNLLGKVKIRPGEERDIYTELEYNEFGSLTSTILKELESPSGEIYRLWKINNTIQVTDFVNPMHVGSGIYVDSFSTSNAYFDGAVLGYESGELKWLTASGGGGGVTAVTASSPLSSSGGATPDISLGTVGVGNGGTGQTSLTLGSLLAGNNAGTVAEIAPGSNGQVLTVVGGAWAAAAPAAGGTAQGGANAVQYANATTPADFDGNANFVYTEATGRLGVGTASPSTTLHVNSGAVNGTAIATLQNTAGDFQVFRVDANPEGSVTGSIGDIADDSTNGVVYVKTSGSATNTGWSPLANLGTKVYLVVEGGQYATIQAAIDATPTGTNTVPAYSVILVGPKANTGGGASGSWGPAVLAANKSLMITGLGGAQTAKDIRIDSLTFDSSAAGLNANLNENYISGLFINSSSATSVVTFGGTGEIRLRLNNCYVNNNGAGDAVTNTNSNVNGSLYLDTCIVSVASTTGIAVRSSGNYTTIRNRTEVSTAVGGTNLSTGRSLSASAGTVEIYDSFLGFSGPGAGVPRPIVELTGSALLFSGQTSIGNTSNDANARCVFINSATATFAAGDTFLSLGSSVAAAGQVVSGTGTFNFGSITFSYSPLLTVATQTPALRTGGWFTTDIKEGISLTSPGSPLFNLNSSGRITRYNDAVPTNGQLLIGDTAAGYFKSALLTGTGISITNGAGSVALATTGLGGKIHWVVTGGSYATLQAAVDAAAAGDVILVGPTATTWGAVTFPAQKELAVCGLGGASHSNMVSIGAVTFSPTTGTAQQNQLWLADLYINGSFTGAQGVLFSDIAPARVRMNGCFISDSGTGKSIVSSNSGVGSSFVIDNCLTDAGDAVASPRLDHTQGYTLVQDTELHGGTSAFSCAGGVLEMQRVRCEYAVAGAVGQINGGQMAAQNLFIRNTTVGGDGVLMSGGTMGLNNSVFDVADGAGYCVRGSGSFFYGQNTYTDAPTATPRNVKVQVPGIAAFPMTQAFTPTV